MGAILGCAFACAWAGSAAALTIIPTYDASITSLSNATQIETAFNAVAKDYAASFTDPVTVHINVSWGTVAGHAMPTGDVGASMDNLYGYFTYNQLQSDLSASAASAEVNTALDTAVKSLAATAPGPSKFVIPSAEAKALGLISGTQASPDGYIGFASTLPYSFSPTAVAAGTYDFEGVAAHEIAEVLGRISGINSLTPAWRTPFDLFRYTAPGVLSYGYKDAAYFSIDGGLTPLKSFNNYSSGDRGDWASTAGVYDVSNAFISKGMPYGLSYADLTALDVLGWGGGNLGNTHAGLPTGQAFGLVSVASAPEPASWALLIAGFGLSGAALRRRNPNVGNRTQSSR